MKTCSNCGKENRNDNTFCSACGGTEFSEPFSADEPAAAPVPPQMPPPPVPPYNNRREPKPPIGVFDVLSILGFVSSIIGLMSIWVVLEPLAVVTSVIGFFKGSRYKGLAAAGFVIAVIAFIIKLFLTLYEKNIIGRWAVDGIF